MASYKLDEVCVGPFCVPIGIKVYTTHKEACNLSVLVAAVSGLMA